MKNLTAEQIKEIERIRTPCRKGICGWCAELKRRYPLNSKREHIAGVWCRFFEQFIKDYDGGDWKQTKRLPECIAACTRKNETE